MYGRVNGYQMPRDVFLHEGGRKRWFKCNVAGCAHEFEVRLFSVTNQRWPTWCPYCAGRKLCQDSSCVQCLARSFASFDSEEKVACWIYGTANGNLTPRDVFLHECGRKRWFRCNVTGCGHEFEMRLFSVTNERRPQWCPYCAGRELCQDSNCAQCLARSFASFDSEEKVACWIYGTANGNLTPRDVFLHECGRKRWFRCNVTGCGHEFEATLNHVTDQRFPSWCPYCAGSKLCQDSSCVQCLARSFASFDSEEKVACWIYGTANGNLTPRDVFLHENSPKRWFRCSVAGCTHDFEVSLSNVTRNLGSWCPYCKNKTEAKLKRHYETEWPDHKLSVQLVLVRKSRFDFAFCRLFLIVELDGNHHFQQVSNWTSPEDNRAKDVLKMIEALRAGYSVHRLLQRDVWEDKDSWTAGVALVMNYAQSRPTEATPIIMLQCREKAVYQAHVTQLRLAVPDVAVYRVDVESGELILWASEPVVEDALSV